MKFLFVGGTGLISSACSDLVAACGHELFILNRSVSRKYSAPQGSIVLQADVYADTEAALAALKDIIPNVPRFVTDQDGGIASA